MSEIVSLQFARETGLTRYYTGNPCKYGHVAERMVSNRKCRQCLVELKKKWSAENVEHRRQQKKAWDDANKEHVREYQRQQAVLFPEKFAAKHKKWQTENKEYVRKKASLFRKDNAQYMNDINKEWRKKNPEAVRIMRRNRRARIKSVGGKHTPKQIEDLFIAQSGLCANPYCKADLTVTGQHADHRMPLALGGSNNIENIQLLCPWCNQSKNCKHPDEWLKQQEKDRDNRQHEDRTGTRRVHRARLS